MSSTADVFVAGEIPHETVFPRMAAVVHHGGAGITAATVRAGVPQAVCPFVGDQPFWAGGCSSSASRRNRSPSLALTALALAAAIRRAITDPAMIESARGLGERVRSENGVATAVDLLEQVGGGLRSTS